VASTPGAVVHATLTIPGQPEHVGTARRFVTAVLGENHPDTDTAILLTSELVTNSLRYGTCGQDGAKVSVAASRAPGCLRVEVTDDGADTLPTLGRASAEAEQGRGLCLVDALATRWDARRDDAGTVTWFEIAT
jgi:anti-sigma regulatory factor (Ser/Thr protein kinase)